MGTNKLAVQTSGQTESVTIPVQMSGQEFTPFSTSYDVASDEELQGIIDSCLASGSETISSGKLGFEFSRCPRFDNSVTVLVTYNGTRVDGLGWWAYNCSFASVRSCRDDIDSLLKAVFKYVPELRALHIAHYESSIQQCLDDVKKSFVQLGVLFKRMRDDNVFPGGLSGTPNKSMLFYEHIDTKYGFKRASVCNLIAIVETFCSPVDIEDSVKGHELMPEFEGYSYSQLTEMLSLPAVVTYLGQRDTCNQSELLEQLPPPTATIADIRALKKGKLPKSPANSWAYGSAVFITPDDEDEEDDKVSVETLESNKLDTRAQVLGTLDYHDVIDVLLDLAYCNSFYAMDIRIAISNAIHDKKVAIKMAGCRMALNLNMRCNHTPETCPYDGKMDMTKCNEFLESI